MREFTLKTAMSLISKMRGMYGKKFTDQWAGVEPNEIAEAMVLCLNGLTDEDLLTGFERMKTSAFCPSIPEFRSWCESSSPYLTENEAWLQAVKFDSSPFGTEISKLAKQAYEMVHVNKNQYIDSNKQNFYMFRDCYLRLVADAKRNGVKDEMIPPPPSIEFKAEPIAKPKLPEQTPEEKAWIEKRTKEHEAEGMSFFRALLEATKEYKAIEGSEGGGA